MKAIGRLAGKQVRFIEAWEGCPCVLLFEDEYKLLVESLWRLGNNKSMLLTSEDDGQTYGHETPINAIAKLGESCKAFMSPMPSQMKQQGTSL